MKTKQPTAMRPEDCRSAADLIACCNAGAQPHYLFFWGQTEDAEGQLSRACLSQWYPSPFVADGLAYASAEHYMMAAKARLFGDEETRARILEAPSPGTAKALGRAVRGFDQPLWEERRFAIVTTASVLKFAQHPRLARFLLGTGSQVLVEASPIDKIWGIGLAEASPRARIPAQWRGINLLGFALMAARAQLVQQG